MQKLQCVRTEVSTLMYVRNGSREFQSATVLLPGGDLIVNDTFPNIRHGFNTRTLTVGTKDVRLQQKKSNNKKAKKRKQKTKTEAFPVFIVVRAGGDDRGDTGGNHDKS